MNSSLNWQNFEAAPHSDLLIQAATLQETCCGAFATKTESAIQEKLQKALTVKDVNVRDTSGGCGTMFEIKVAADEFKNKSIVQQHKVMKLWSLRRD
ncbi:hypothetical protein WJX77_005873 [Trebouxia sp. C0004]